MKKEDEIGLENRPVLDEHEPPPRKGGKGTLLVFVSVLVALAMLIGLNMN